MKIVFMGTPDFAVGSLKALYEAGHEILLCVTQPDKQQGRGKKIKFSAVKEYAVSVGIPVFTPDKIKKPENVEELKKYPADVFVVAAFGQILSKEILDMPKYGCINVHASLLPKYRGAAPIQWSILKGEKETGVTIMQMNEGLDTGDMLSKTVVPITAEDTGDSLHDKLMEAGAALLLETLKRIEAGEISPEKQPDECPFYAKMLDKGMGLLDFSLSAAENDLYIRALNSWPSAFTKFQGKTLKIWSAGVVFKAPCGLALGEVFEVKKDSFLIACAEGALEIFEVQLEGKKRMKAGDFLRGNKVEQGMILG